MRTGEARVLMQTERHIEAPNWDPAGDSLVVNGGGLLYRVPLDAPRLHGIDTGFADRCNNDHGISPDGTQIAISHHGSDGSEIYVIPATGGSPVAIMDMAPSYWHGWSPDGRQMAYVAKRGDARHYDVYTIAAAGGPERRLTQGEGHCDGPDYSADGTEIWYNCDRTGHAQIWKMGCDGTDQRQVFEDEFVNWFPHPSPDGSTILYLAFPPGTEGHPANRDVGLRLIDPDGGNMREVARFIGGQGTINVPCWAPDSSAFAYVRYLID